MLKFRTSFLKKISKLIKIDGLYENIHENKRKDLSYNIKQNFQ